MIVTDLSKSFNPVPKEKPKEEKQLTKVEKKTSEGKKSKAKKTKTTKKKKTAIKGKKHKQTKEKEIPKKVKEAVWKRDKHRCIFCKKEVDVFYANAHFIPRSAGGLGIEENIFTACEECHREQDNGKKTKEYDQKAKKYLKSIYGSNWNIEKLIYKKF